MSEKEVLRLTNLVYPFLKSDFYLPWSNEQVNKVVLNNLKVLIELGLIVKNDKNLLTKPENDKIHQIKLDQRYLAIINLSLIHILPCRRTNNRRKSMMP